MTVEHVVLFTRTRPGSPGDEVESRLREAARALAGIPGVLELSVGRGDAPTSRGATHALVIRFRDRAALAEFLPHPTHREVGAWLVDEFDDFDILDYDIRA
jgi:heme-degrading monooxygenase HmoA